MFSGECKSAIITIFFLFISTFVFSLENSVWKITRNQFTNIFPCFSKSGRVYFLSNKGIDNLGSGYDFYVVDSHGFTEPILIPTEGYETLDKIEFNFFSYESRVVFTFTAEGQNSDIYVADIDSSGYQLKNIQQITSDVGIDKNPTGLNSGDKIFFTTNRSGTNQIWSYTFSTSNLTEEVDNASMPFVSYDDSFLLYVSDNDGQIYRYNLSDKSSDKISEVAEVKFFYPRCSYDNKKVIATGDDGSVYLFPLFTTEAEPALSFPVTAQKLELPSYYYRYADFCPSGGMIMLAFSSSATDSVINIGKSSSLFKVQTIDTSTTSFLGLFPSLNSGNSFYSLLKKDGLWEVTKVDNLLAPSHTIVFTSEEGIYSFNFSSDEKNLFYLKNAYYGNELWLYDLEKDKNMKLSAPDRRTVGGGSYEDKAYFFKYENGKVTIYKTEFTGSNPVSYGELPDNFSVIDYYFNVASGDILFSAREEQYQRLIYFNIPARTTEYLTKEALVAINRFPSCDSDFKNVVFTSGRHGGFNLWIYNRSQDEMVKVTVGEAMDKCPVFLKDGLLALREEGSQGYIIFIPVNISSLSSLKRELFQGNREDLLRLIETRLPHSLRQMQQENYRNFFGK